MKDNTDNITKAESHVTAALLFLAGTALSLWTSAPFFGWGAGPETGLGAMTLKRVSLFGYPLAQTAGRLSSLIPTDSPEFSAALLFAVLFGLTLVFIYKSAARISNFNAAGVLASVAFASFPQSVAAFQSCSKDGWTLFLMSLLFFTAVNYFRQPGKQALCALTFAAGIGMFHSGFLSIAGLALITAAAVKHFQSQTGRVGLPSRQFAWKSMERSSHVQAPVRIVIAACTSVCPVFRSWTLALDR